MKSVSLPAAMLVTGLLLGACSLAQDVTPPPGVAPLQSVIPSGPDVGATEVVARLPDRPPDPAAGAAIYADKCEACHGPSGMGDGSQASNLPNPPARLGDPLLARAALPADWYEMVTSGNIERFMPGFQSLTDAQRWEVVAYALTLSDEGSLRPQAGDAYRLECAECHGETGGGSPSAPALNEPSAMAARSLQSVYDDITFGVGETMPAFAERWSEEERWALASFVRGLAFASATVQSTPSAAAATDQAVESETPAATSEAAVEATPAAVETAVLTGTVRGSVVQGTSGAALPSGLEVTLHAYDGQAEVLTQTAAVDAQGTFEFSRLDVVAGRLFVVTAEADGVTYGSEAVHLSDAGQADDLLLLVYEATEEVQALRADRIHLLVNFPTEGTVELIQLWLISNDSDRTVVAPAGQGVLTFSLPPGALDLTFEEGSDPERFVVTNDGFVDRLPVRPGSMSSQVVFSYVLPYDGRMDFSQPVSLPVEEGILIVPEGGPELSGEGLQDQGAREMSGTSVRTYSLGPVAPGGSVDFRLSGRLRVAGQPGNTLASVAIGIGVLGVALIAAGLWWYRRPEPARVRPVQPLESESRQMLLQQIADLDRARAAGQIEESDYQVRRAALKERVLELMRGERD